MKELNTIKDVLEECLVIWDELARTGAEYKPDTDYKNDCPCCHWVKLNYGTNKGLKCEHCPLWELWGDQPCEEGGSPYFNWNYRSFTSNDRKIQAKLIADYCRDRLKEMQ